MGCSWPKSFNCWGWNGDTSHLTHQPSNSGKWRFIVMIAYWKCNPGGDWHPGWGIDPSGPYFLGFFLEWGCLTILTGHRDRGEQTKKTSIYVQVWVFRYFYNWVVVRPPLWKNSSKSNKYISLHLFFQQKILETTTFLYMPPGNIQDTPHHTPASVEPLKAFCSKPSASRRTS